MWFLSANDLQVVKESLRVAANVICDALYRQNIQRPASPVKQQCEKHRVQELGQGSELAEDSIGIAVGVKLRSDTLDISRRNNCVGGGRHGAPPLIGNVAVGKDNRKAPIFVVDGLLLTLFTAHAEEKHCMDSHSLCMHRINS